MGFLLNIPRQGRIDGWEGFCVWEDCVYELERNIAWYGGWMVQPIDVAPRLS